MNGIKERILEILDVPYNLWSYLGIVFKWHDKRIKRVVNKRRREEEKKRKEMINNKINFLNKKKKT